MTTSNPHLLPNLSLAQLTAIEDAAYAAMRTAVIRPSGTIDTGRLDDLLAGTGISVDWIPESGANTQMVIDCPAIYIETWPLSEADPAIQAAEDIREALTLMANAARG